MDSGHDNRDTWLALISGVATILAGLSMAYPDWPVLVGYRVRLWLAYRGDGGVDYGRQEWMRERARAGGYQDDMEAAASES